MAYSTTKTAYGQSKGYAQQNKYTAQSTYRSEQPERKKTLRFIGCTCGGCSPCRGTCRTFTTE